ncbi:unnamed protein product [Spirodela intermedia]|uniref:Uncharacterized protein n=1 Tax=Spirodela intermedia TaxID=51605 RepID=A0A7I8J3T4_SPIIN|nr:unnamed protein product [Spirodela intermedia]CAA6664721.1 unnamed protein product [Spirodela intermedia]
MAYDDCYYHLGAQLPSMAWNLDDLEDATASDFAGGHGILGDHVSLALESLHRSELRSGYLEDAVAQWGGRCKRRRTLLFPHDQAAAEGVGLEDLVRGFWNYNSYLHDLAAGPSSFAGDEMNGPNLAGELRLPSPSSSSPPDGPPQFRGLPVKELAADSGPEKKKTAATRRRKVVYPFAVVRSGGFDGGATLEDINRRLLMRPSRPIRHPIGEFACLPCVSGDGPGLSGKAIVGLTRISTRGRGTITIIRTKG